MPQPSGSTQPIETPADSGGSSADRYLDLLKGCLTRELFIGEEVRNVDLREWPLGDPEDVRSMLRSRGWRVVRHTTEPDRRQVGDDWPPHAETMVGRARLDNVQELVTRAITESVPGDLVETGVWRGGTVALMRAVLAAHGDEARTVWACDSFAGLPEADAQRFPQDVPMKFHTYPELAVSLDQVRANIARYDLLDDRIRFLEGWFRDTLPTAPIERIAVLRLDGDMYESTMDGLVHLEPKVSPGGFVVVDDYGGIEACAAAVDEYRAQHDITDPLHTVDWTAVWWQTSPR